MELVKIVRITQILMDEGWQFIDNGIDNIEMMVNESADEKIVFSDAVSFESWLQEKMVDFQI